jgi:hypothetical protein
LLLFPAITLVVLEAELVHYILHSGSLDWTLTKILFPTVAPAMTWSKRKLASYCDRQVPALPVPLLSMSFNVCRAFHQRDVLRLNSPNAKYRQQ